MPRPRLPSEERRRRNNARLARWRHGIRASNSQGQGSQAQAAYPFIHTTSTSIPQQATTLGVSGGWDDNREGWLGIEEEEYLSENNETRSVVREGVSQDTEGSIEDQGAFTNFTGDEEAINGLLDSKPESERLEVESEEELEQEYYCDEQVADQYRIETEEEEDLSNIDSCSPSTRGSARTEEEEDLSKVDSCSLSTLGSARAEEDDESLLAAQIQREAGLQSIDDELDDEDEVDLAEELARQVIHFKSCGATAHHEANRQHSYSLLRAGDQARHLSLNGYLNHLRESDVPIVIDKSGFLSRTEREAHNSPNWQRIFEGRETRLERDRDQFDSEPEDRRSRSDSEQETNRDQSDQEQNKNWGHSNDCLCLICSQTNAETVQVGFDIDSFLGYTRSLAFAKQGLDINLFPRFHSNIQSNLHLYTTVYYDYGRGEKPMKVKVQKVPHYCLGRVLGHEDISVYIFFPQMYDPQKTTNFPGSNGAEKHNLLRTWTDSILIPAIFHHVPASSRQHFPSSWDHARGKAEAYYKERYTRGDPNEPPDQSRSLQYPLHPYSLAAIWEEIEQQLQEPPYQIYRGAQLFFASKNTKLRFTYPTLSGAWEAFNQALHTTIDLSYCDRNQVWLDLGKEIVGTDYSLAQERFQGDSTPTTHLLRTCCLENFGRWAALGEPGRSVIATHYPAAMLKDAGDITLEMSRSSRKRREGWVFSQAYNSYKEIFDAAKTKPFGSPYLGQLTWDSLVAKMIRKQGRGYQVPHPRLQRNYQESKSRLFKALRDGAGLSFGIREEHRISLAFFERMQGSLLATGDWFEPQDRTGADLKHSWCLSTTEYLAYLGHNANKFMAAFEWILSYNQKGRISYEHCKLMSMLLQALPFTFDSGPIMQQAGLWKDHFQRRDNGPQVLGMGLQSTLKRYGYMWFLPRVDWETMAFRERFATNMAFGNSMLRDFYRQNWGRVKDSKDDYARIEAAGQWLQLYQTNGCCKDMIITVLLLCVIRAYRKEVFAYLKPLCRADLPNLYQEAARGEIVLCYAELERLLTPESMANIHIVNCKRTKIQSIEDLVSLLWGFDDGQSRGRWEHSSFRVLCRRAVEVVEECCGPTNGERFHEMVKRYFIATHWLIPYPSPAKLFRKNLRKETVWIAVYHQRLVYSQRRQGAKISAKQLARTVQPRPSWYRPQNFLWPIPDELFDNEHLYREQDYARELEKCIPARVRYMEDWDVRTHDRVPIMSQTPVENIREYQQAETSLETIREVLEQQWQEDMQLDEAE